MDYYRKRIQQKQKKPSGAIKYDDDVKDEDVEDGDTIFSFIYEDNGGVNGISLNNIVFDEKFMVIRIKKGTY